MFWKALHHVLLHYMVSPDSNFINLNCQSIVKVVIIGTQKYRQFHVNAEIALLFFIHEI